MLVDVILPVPMVGMLTYNVPFEMAADALVGCRVLVPLGKKIETGIIVGISTAEDSDISYRDVVCMLDDSPLLSARDLQLWQWVAEYYMCSLGDVMRAALPALLKLESTTRVRLETEDTDLHLTPQQQTIYNILSDGKEHDVQEIARRLQIRSAMPALSKMMRAGIVCTTEDVTDKYRPKYEDYVVLHTDQDLQVVLDSLSRAPQQQSTLLEFLELSHYGELPVSKRQLKSTGLKALIDKQILSVERQRVGRQQQCDSTQTLHTLTEAQQTALEQIKTCFAERDVVLLHGVTSSGKTDIYMHLIAEVLDSGHDVLYLLPEIALTTQLTDRLARVFGERMVVYHSRISDNERAEVYEQVYAARQPLLIVGVRSSVFLPFRHLSLVIVDEEHETSYKQQEATPRYHARSVAIVLAKMSGAKVLLGSATPAVESYYNAMIGKYGLVRLALRYGDLQLPKTQVIDLRQARHRKEIEGSMSDYLVARLRHTLIDENKQAIVFINRRGYAPYMQCKQCGYIPHCVNCDISLTLHRQRNILTCHYCGYTIAVPDSCPDCGQPLIDRGVGTEKAEDELARLFPEKQMSRMDLDTTRRKQSYQQIIDDFSARRTHILVGTQMISKGLDFDGVSLVAVLNCDSVLNQPDYRSAERAFQLIEQVSGRAGRKDRQGEVVIQTNNPDNEILCLAAKHDYETFYQQQIAERQLFRYPPFYRLLYVVVSHADYHIADDAALALDLRLKQVFTHRCSGVVVPMLSRVQNRYIRHIILKFKKEEAISKGKLMLAEQIRQLQQDPRFKTVRIYVDVDP